MLPALPVVIVAGMAVMAALLWRIVPYLFAELSGWNRLAERYAAAEPMAWAWRSQTMRVGVVRYRRAMRMTALPEGLYLAGSWMLRNQTLRIPWGEMTDARAGRLYGRPSVVVTVGQPAVTTLEFPLELYNAIRGAPPW